MKRKRFVSLGQDDEDSEGSYEARHEPELPSPPRLLPTRPTPLDDICARAEAQSRAAADLIAAQGPGRYPNSDSWEGRE